jgi:hypothetical protein
VQLTARLRLAQEEGALPAELDLDLLNSQLVGPIFYRRFFSRQAYDPAFVPSLVDQVLQTQLHGSRRTPVRAWSPGT